VDYFKVEAAKNRGWPRKIWKQVMDKDKNDLHLKPSYAMDRSKWREMSRGNWSDSNSDIDAVS